MDGALRVRLLDVKNDDRKSSWWTSFISSVLFCALEGKRTDSRSGHQLLTGQIGIVRGGMSVVGNTYKTYQKRLFVHLSRTYPVVQ
jgi:hypothetical protein